MALLAANVVDSNGPNEIGNTAEPERSATNSSMIEAFALAL
jgi:hypothetical protein